MTRSLPVRVRVARLAKESFEGDERHINSPMFLHGKEAWNLSLVEEERIIIDLALSCFPSVLIWNGKTTPIHGLEGKWIACQANREFITPNTECGYYYILGPERNPAGLPDSHRANIWSLQSVVKAIMRRRFIFTDPSVIQRRHSWEYIAININKDELRHP